ncbi:MAG: arginine--tRNA ligase [Planctomycetes bacterium]|nr:arginine--tRNA ligase [Planctomycetota bacterium]
MSIISEIKEAILDATKKLADEGAIPSAAEGSKIEIDICNRPEVGEYQTNIALKHSKDWRLPPLEIVERLAGALDDRFKGTATKPGFLNLRVSGEVLSRHLSSLFTDESLGVERTSDKRPVIVDYSSPNVAKPPHVGHLRSTVIGDAILRMLKFKGHEVIGDNHLGDWGTHFGKVIVAFRNFADQAEFRRAPLDELARIYSSFKTFAEQDPSLEDKAREELAKLQAKDPENYKTWQEFVEISKNELERIYDRLEVKFDHWHGESFYHDLLSPLCEDYERRKVARESDGALAIFFGDFGVKLPTDTPLLIRKQDGAFLYATSDLAAIRYRMQTWNPSKILYVTDVRQSLHFEQVFAASKIAENFDTELVHVPFGIMKLASGAAFGSRDGNVIKLDALLDEAEEKALALIRDSKGKVAVPEEEWGALAKTIGNAAVKYGDLRQKRTSNIIFDFDEFLSFDGDTGPYLQYVHARIHGLFRKAGLTVRECEPREIDFDGEGSSEKRIIASTLLSFDRAFEKALADLTPHVLCGYLFELSQRFNSFYEKCRIITDDEIVTRERLFFCGLVAKIIKTGLGLLGIQAPERL